ncbi:unannotated protein [freshwater metagenome]|uniref:Unannotated protein n=1 Tax=freshwater metagenome TaxID=449393 RepID=A0A6J7FPH0_9ZZZZ
MSNRDRLLEAAIEAIERDGEAALRVDQVAEAVGVTKPSIYHFFHDRDGLIVAAQAERYRRSITYLLADLDLDIVLECESQAEYARLIHAVVMSSTSPDGVLRRRLRAQVLGSAVSRPALQESVGEVHRQTVATLAKVLGYGQKRGWFRPEFSSSAVAAWWFGAIFGRHLVEDYSNADDANAWPAITWSTIAHLMGVSADL